MATAAPSAWTACYAREPTAAMRRRNHRTIAARASTNGTRRSPVDELSGDELGVRPAHLVPGFQGGSDRAVGIGLAGRAGGHRQAHHPAATPFGAAGEKLSNALDLVDRRLGQRVAGRVAAIGAE